MIWRHILWSKGLTAGVVLIRPRGALRSVLFAQADHEGQGGAFYDGLAKHEAAPTRLLLPVLALMTVNPWMPLAPVLVSRLNHAMGLALIACIAWLLVALLDVLQDCSSHRHALEISDNLAARRVRTQVQVLRPVAVVVIAILTIAIMVMTSPTCCTSGKVFSHRPDWRPWSQVSRHALRFPVCLPAYRSLSANLCAWRMPSSSRANGDESKISP